MYTLKTFASGVRVPSCPSSPSLLSLCGGEDMERISAVAACVCLCAMMLVQGDCSAEQAKPMVGMYYFPGWCHPKGEQGEWQGAIIKAATPRALCGFYNDADPKLWNYYVPWMSTHGIDFIAFDWYYNAEQEFLNGSLDSGYLKSPKNKDIKFCLHWCNHGGPWWKKPLDQSKSAILTMTDSICEKYFSKPNYLRINGRPVFMIYETNMLLSFGGIEGVRDSLAAMRARAKEKGYPDLYLVAVYPGNSPDYLKMLKGLGFDAFCAYTYCWMRPASVTWDTHNIPYAELTDMLTKYVYPKLRQEGVKAGLPYWPSTFSGWDDRPRAGLENALVNTGNTPEQYAKMLKGALKQVNPASPVVMTEAWNEWGEGACIEPSKEHGFGFLKAIASVTGKSSPNEKVPTAEEIASWNVLTPDELKTAKENESKPWPIKEPKKYVFGKSYSVPKAKLPFVVNFEKGGMKDEEMTLVQMELKGRTEEGAVFETTGGDPCIILPTVKVPMKQIKRITIEGGLEGDVMEGFLPPRLQVYWATGRMPEFAEFASTATTWSKNGKTFIQTVDIPTWKDTGTPLLRLRIDPCSKPGVKLHIRRVILSD